MKTKMILLIVLLVFLVGNVEAAERRDRRRIRRQPIFESYKTERYIENRRSGGRGNMNQIRFIRKTTIHRRYKKVCRDNRGKRKECR